MRVNLFHFNSIEVILSAVVKLDLTLSIVIFVAVEFIIACLKEIWIGIKVIFPNLIARIICLYFVGHMVLVYFWLCCILLLLLLGLGLFVLLIRKVNLLPLIGMWCLSFLIIKFLRLRCLFWLFWCRLAFTNWTLHLWYEVIVFILSLLFSDSLLIIWEASIEVLHLGEILRVWAFAWNVQQLQIFNNIIILHYMLFLWLLLYNLLLLQLPHLLILFHFHILFALKLNLFYIAFGLFLLIPQFSHRH